MWGTGAAPYMHAMLLGWPVGGTVGPLVAGLFVSSSNNYTDAVTSSPHLNDSLHDNWNASDVSDCKYPDCSTIQYAYFIAGFLHIASALSFFIFNVFQYKNKKYLAKSKTAKKKFGWKEIVSPSKWTEGKPILGISQLVCMIIFFTALNSQDNAIGFYLPTYAIDSNLGFTEQEAATLNSINSLAGSVSRIITIFLLSCLSVRFLFTAYMTSAVLSILLLGVFGTTSKTSLMVFTAIYGFCWRPLRGYVYGFLNLHMIMIAAVFGFETCIVNILQLPLMALHGYMYDVLLESIFYLGLLYILVDFVVHVVMIAIGKYYGTLEERRRDMDPMEVRLDADDEQDFVSINSSNAAEAFSVETLSKAAVDGETNLPVTFINPIDDSTYF